LNDEQQVLAGLDTAVASGGGGLAAADALCRACVDLLQVDGAAISLMYEGASRGTFGSSGELSRRLDEFQFTFGEGPCLEAVSTDRPVMVADLAMPGEGRWPAFTGAVLEAGVRAVFAWPVTIAAVPVGAIDFFCHQPGPLDQARIGAARRAAELAALPLLDLMGAARAQAKREKRGSVRPELASLARVEVYQATGMLVAQLDIGPAEALVRLRGYAFSHGMTASEVAWAVVNRELSFSKESGNGVMT
jgi:GAF domain/ANTAR domain